MGADNGRWAPPGISQAELVAQVALQSSLKTSRGLHYSLLHVPTGHMLFVDPWYKQQGCAVEADTHEPLAVPKLKSFIVPEVLPFVSAVNIATFGLLAPMPTQQIWQTALVIQFAMEVTPGNPVPLLSHNTYMRLQHEGPIEYIVSCNTEVGHLKSVRSPLYPAFATLSVQGQVTHQWALRPDAAEPVTKLLLSSTELEVLKAVQQGETVAKFATRTGTRPATVETHRKNITRKLGARNIAAAARLATQFYLLGLA